MPVPYLSNTSSSQVDQITYLNYKSKDNLNGINNRKRRTIHFCSYSTCKITLYPT
jgi:hypothetical protein